MTTYRAPTDLSEFGDFRGVDPDRGDGRSLAWRVRQPIVPIGKSLLRRAGTATASQRCLPDFVIIGGKRTGSTTLHRNLVREDDVLGLWPAKEDLKGTYFFDVNYSRGEDWYRSHFVTRRHRDAVSAELGRPVVTGEASPYYFQHPHAPARAAALLPDTKFIVTIREPIERAYSHYRERCRQGIETLPTFEAALDAEPGRLDGELDAMRAVPGYVSWNHLNFAYVGQSLYAAALQRWIDEVGHDRLLVLHSDEMFAAPEATLDTVRDFIGLHHRPSPTADHHNNNPGTTLSEAIQRRLDAAFGDDQAATQAILTGWP